MNWEDWSQAAKTTYCVGKGRMEIVTATATEQHINDGQWSLRELLTLNEMNWQTTTG